MAPSAAHPAPRLPAHAAASAATRVRRGARGVGAVLDPALAEFLLAHPAALDYVALVPETLWTDAGRGTAQRHAELPAAVAMADALAARYPVVLHGTGLSIGSAMPLDEAHLAQVARVAARHGARRYVERLGFCRVPTAPGRDRPLGLQMPLPCDAAVLDWLAPRVRRAGQLAGLPLLLQNSVHHTPYRAEDMPEPVFLNRLAEASGCGLLLDLHHLYTDWCHNGSAPEDYLAQLDLRWVREIRVASGPVPGRACGDARYGACFLARPGAAAAAGGCPPTVLALLRTLVPRCPALEGITFDATAAPHGAPQALCEQLDALTALWALREMEARDALDRGDCHVA